MPQGRTIGNMSPFILIFVGGGVMCGWSDRWSLLFLLVIFLKGLHPIFASLEHWNNLLAQVHECLCSFLSWYFILALPLHCYNFQCLVPLGPSLQIIRGKCQGPIGVCPSFFWSKTKITENKLGLDKFV